MLLITVASKAIRHIKYFMPILFLINSLFAQVLTGGYYHTVLLCEDSTLTATGRNAYGQLGTNNSDNQIIPVQLPGLNNIVAVSAGADHTIALKNDGTVYSWGINDHGQLGRENYNNDSVPNIIPGLNGIIAIAAGEQFSLALRADGKIFSFGKNSSGQLGIGTYVNQPNPAMITILNNISAISAGQSHSIAVKNDGSVWAWGSNTYGQLGTGNNTNALTPVQLNITDVIKADAGIYHSSALKNDGTVWSWGFNEHGNLGDNTIISNNSPVLTNNISSVIDISVGQSHTVALKDDGTIWTWGNNYYGQIGDNTTNNKTEPIMVGSFPGGVSGISTGLYYSLAYDSTGSAWALGDSTNNNQNVPVKVKSNCLIKNIKPACNTTINISTNSLSVCAGEMVEFSSSGSTVFDFEWKNNNNIVSNDSTLSLSFSSSGQYVIKLIANKSGNCKDSSEIIIDVNPLPDATFQLPVSSCENNNDIDLQPNTTGGTWQGSGINGDFFSPSDAGAGTFNIGYYITDVNGCSDSAIKTITVFPPPSITISGTTDYCENDLISLSASGGNSYLWNTGDTTSQISYTASVSDTLLVSVTDTNNCTSAESISILVEPLPVSSFQYTLSNDTFYFANNSLNYDNLSWSFGDGNYSSDENPFHQYLLNGQYDVLLIVYNNCGSDTFSLTINVTTLNAEILNSHASGKVHLFPNPTSGNFTILSADLIIQELQLFNISGKLVWKKVINSNQYKTAVNNLPAGTYLARIIHSEGIEHFPVIILE
jgi:alpha-tubulin suppressor-like RCC1 family protein/PKD repeat protein